MMIIMILSYNVSLYGLVFLSLSGFFSLMTYHSSGFWGLSRQIPTGALTLDDPKIPCQCPPPPNQNPGSAPATASLLAYSQRGSPCADVGTGQTPGQRDRRGENNAPAADRACVQSARTTFTLRKYVNK